jgi:hypothetical protein
MRSSMNTVAHACVLLVTGGLMSQVGAATKAPAPAPPPAPRAAPAPAPKAPLAAAPQPAPALQSPALTAALASPTEKFKPAGASAASPVPAPAPTPKAPLLAKPMSNVLPNNQTLKAALTSPTDKFLSGFKPAGASAASPVPAPAPTPKAPLLAKQTPSVLPNSQVLTAALSSPAAKLLSGLKPVIAPVSQVLALGAGVQMAPAGVAGSFSELLKWDSAPTPSATSSRAAMDWLGTYHFETSVTYAAATGPGLTSDSRIQGVSTSVSKIYTDYEGGQIILGGALDVFNAASVVALVFNPALAVPFGATSLGVGESMAVYFSSFGKAASTFEKTAAYTSSYVDLVLADARQLAYFGRGSVASADARLIASQSTNRVFEGASGLQSKYAADLPAASQVSDWLKVSGKTVSLSDGRQLQAHSNFSNGLLFDSKIKINKPGSPDFVDSVHLFFFGAGAGNQSIQASEAEPPGQLMFIYSEEKWPRSFEQHSPIYKWTAGGLVKVQSCPRRRSALATNRPTRWATRGAPQDSS